MLEFTTHKIRELIFMGKGFTHAHSANYSCESNISSAVLLFCFVEKVLRNQQRNKSKIGKITLYRNASNKRPGAY